MNKKIAAAIFLLLVAALVCGSVLAGSGDENYNGEDDEQPGIGVDIGTGEANDEMPQADRTRNKDN